MRFHSLVIVVNAFMNISGSLATGGPDGADSVSPEGLKFTKYGTPHVPGGTPAVPFTLNVDPGNDNLILSNKRCKLTLYGVFKGISEPNRDPWQRLIGIMGSMDPCMNIPESPASASTHTRGYVDPHRDFLRASCLESDADGVVVRGLGEYEIWDSDLADKVRKDLGVSEEAEVQAALGRSHDQRCKRMWDMRRRIDAGLALSSGIAPAGGDLGSPSLGQSPQHKLVSWESGLAFVDGHPLQAERSDDIGPHPPIPTDTEWETALHPPRAITMEVRYGDLVIKNKRCELRLFRIFFRIPEKYRDPWRRLEWISLLLDPCLYLAQDPDYEHHNQVRRPPLALWLGDICHEVDAEGKYVDGIGTVNILDQDLVDQLIPEIAVPEKDFHICERMWDIRQLVEQALAPDKVNEADIWTLHDKLHSAP